MKRKGVNNQEIEDNLRSVMMSSFFPYLLMIIFFHNLSF